jgi:hypothetical protein
LHQTQGKSNTFKCFGWTLPKKKKGEVGGSRTDITVINNTKMVRKNGLELIQAMAQ